ncbi:hypothetical protein [Natronorubrum halalkaliphilum]|uniref:hypothetical protein n=1 Tax=Natronorubrum halalkaliphilum TaxID=2691917 RepID=UPI002E2C5049|nr:hypothetical protein [Natronorubrum halalkaliphilum]
MGHVEFLDFLVGRRLGQFGLEVLEFAFDVVEFPKLQDEQVALRFDHAIGGVAAEAQRDSPVE